jgi:hypothetical protein
MGILQEERGRLKSFLDLPNIPGPLRRKSKSNLHLVDIAIWAISHPTEMNKIISINSKL